MYSGTQETAVMAETLLRKSHVQMNSQSVMEMMVRLKKDLK